jgi:aminoglycoside phosphotransferase (APT) family kinase protein
MSPPGEGPGPGSRVDTAQLRAAVEHCLARPPAAPARVVRLDRRPLQCRSSFTLEELDIALDDGTSVQMVFKDLGQAALLEAAREAKPPFLYDPRREIEVYGRILAPLGLRTAACHGSVTDERAARYWLFLEKVRGKELFQVGELGAWEEAARWLASLHSRLASQAAQLASAAGLIRYDAEHYRVWMRRAQAFPGRLDGAGPATRSRLERLAARYEDVVRRLLSLPVTVIHGDYYPSNVLVCPSSGGWRVCPVDWEMAGLGPGLIDLAALTAGKWSGEQRAALVRAYREALPPGDAATDSPEPFADALDLCRLHLAVQWLGWSAGWSPPPEHRYDWLGEALSLADRFGY